tara:strand:- start:401 stop:736 length:336 start_codon:yes stop_codon:yes gene_type:complete
MLVDFKASWFAPTAIVIKDKIQHISGRRFKRGVQEVPDELKDILPTTAKIVKDIPAEKIQPEPSLQDYDMARVDADRENETREEAQKEAKRARMAHARKAKGAKKGNETVE